MKVLGHKVYLVVIYVIMKTISCKILAFSTCPKYTNTLQIGKSADLYYFFPIVLCYC